ncbi:MAG: translocation/assembly module TamB, partial [Pedobacter sp.]
DVVLTKQDIDADLYMMSELGEVETKLSVQNFNKPQSAVYTGYVHLTDFNVSTLINDKTIGKVSLSLDVDGRGFTKESLNTVIKGEISSLPFNNYNYRNLTVDGRMKWPFFQGKLNSNDPNLRMSFDGLLDMSRNSNKYDFHAQIDYADLKALTLMKKDTISIFKGDMVLKASGTNLNNLAGTLTMSDLYYQKNAKEYFFDDFVVESVFDEDRVRTININSTDIVQGTVTGKYDTKELAKLVENALGSLYTNYSPHKVKPGQFLDFNFTIYNKVVEVIMPRIIIGDSTTVRGRINADKGDFRVAFSSPNITAFDNYFSNIEIDVNNKNPLYNAYVSMDSVRTKNYKISDFSLINVTQNDTLYMRSEFKGGNQAQDYFNLNLYHTIDKDNKSVVGLKKSEINFKNYLWYLNENDTRDNKVVFNKKLTDFSIEKISLSHNDQKMELMGVLRDSTYKDIKLSFNDVELQKVTPSIDSLNFGGRVNGNVTFKQLKNEYHPESSLTIDSLKLNKYDLGDLSLQITGDQSLRKFNVNTSLIRNQSETFFANGAIEIVDKQTTLDIDAGFSDFDISPLAVFLKSIFPDMRGLASGRARVVGNAKEPEIDGRLYLKEAGLKVGYLNTDFDFEDNAVIDLTEELILFRNMQITDTKYGTKGSLNGTVKHKVFKNWALDLTIDSDRLLVLDTEDSDDAMYYGTAFIKGTATIAGPTTGLIIKVDATSEKGTDIKIPINNTGSGGTGAYIHFLS